MSWDAISARSGEIDSAGPVILLTPMFGLTTGTIPANEAKYIRFIPRRTMDIDAIRFRVQGVDAADPNVEVGIYDGDSLERLVTSGAVAGKLNAGGIQDVTIPQITLVGGKVYYVAIVSNGAAVATIQSTTISNAGFGLFLGAAPPDLIVGTEAAANPLPAVATMAGSGTTTLQIFGGVEAT